jgi:hypothetical protein
MRFAMARLSSGLGLPDRALYHYQRLVPWAPNRPETYRAMDGLAARGRDPAGAISQAHPDCLCLFVGYPRSGHSLVGSLLDAHPEVVLAHEFNTLQGLQRGLPPRELTRFLRYNAAAFAALGRGWSGYSYKVPGQWQGTASRLRVLGDKKGAGASRHLARHPELLQRLEAEFEWPVTFLHVVRNPFDNIATWSRRQGITLERASECYFRMAETVSWLKERWPQDRFLDVHLGDFTAHPAGELFRLLQGLGVPEVSEEYLAAAGEVVFESPRKTRANVEWSPGLVSDIARRCESFPFLRRYTAKAERP